MECNFKIGQKVVCIDDQIHQEWRVPGRVYTNSLLGLKCGEVYTITDIRVNKLNNAICLFLKEIIQPGNVNFNGFRHVRFRSLDEKKEESKRKTNIDVFKRMCDKNYSPKEIEKLLTEYLGDDEDNISGCGRTSNPIKTT